MLCRMRRLVCLDGLRGVLAVYVMLSHTLPFAPLPHWLHWLFQHGGAAVDVFFILSGLVIVQSLTSFEYRPLPFLIARVARIYPVFLVVFVLAVAVQPLATGFERMAWIDPDSPARDIWSGGWPSRWGGFIATHLTMTHGLFPNGVLPDVWVGFLGAAWALCAVQGGADKLLPPLVWTVCLAAQVLPSSPRKRGSGGWVPACAGMMAAVLQSRPLVWLGAVSYCIYLVNEPLQKLLGVTLAMLVHGDAALFTALWIPGAVALPILASWWLHERVEVPAQRYGRGLALTAVSAG